MPGPGGIPGSKLKKAYGLGRDGTQPKHQQDSWRKGKYVFKRLGSEQPFIFTVASSIPALYTASATQQDVLQVPGLMFDFYQTTAQTLPPRVNAKGLIISGDLVDNETNEFVPGGVVGANNPYARTIGTDAFYIRATFEVTDVSGTDQFLIGYRSNEAFTAATSFLTTGDALYTDFCAIGFCATSTDPQTVRVATDINNAGSTSVSSTAFTWADTKVHTLEMQVDIFGKATFLINDVPCGGTVSKDALGVAITAQVTTAPTAFTFDPTDLVIPFIFYRNDTTTPGAAYMSELEMGLLEHKK